jgi:F0F1-type ATP synthase assembly protein I
MSQDPTPREMAYYAQLAQTGLEMVVPAVAGHFIDGWLETTPWITIIAAAFGFTAGLIHLITIVNRKARDESSDKKPPP